MPDEIELIEAASDEKTPKRGRPTNDERMKKKHAFFLADFDAIWSKQQEVREQCRAERRFAMVPGAQWAGPFGEQFENVPKLEANKVMLAIKRIFSEYRNNRASPVFEPKDGVAGPGGDKLADTCAGLFRADEQDSAAEEAYDNAFEEGVAGGMGGVVLRERYVDEYDDDDTRQRIVIDPVFEADSCMFFDLDAKRQDKKDAKRGYLLTGYSRAGFEEEFGRDAAPWPAPRSTDGFMWCTDETVYAAEVYELEVESYKVRNYIDASGAKMKLEEGADEDGDPVWLDCESGLAVDPRSLKAQGFEFQGEKQSKRQRVRKYVMTGDAVERDCGLISGCEIPLAPFYALRAFVEGVEHAQGHTRTSMDMQRLGNMLRSKLAEICAYPQVSTPIVTPAQIEGHRTQWEDHSAKRFPYLLLNPTIDPTTGAELPAPPLAYTKPPEVPPVLAALMQLAEADLADLLGNQEAAEEIKSNVSGKAVEIVSDNLDMQTFIYISNYAKMVRRVGEIWIGKARDHYTQKGRKLKIVTPQGEKSAVELKARTLVDKSTGKTYLENDITRANFDTLVDVGPSSKTKRAATVRAVTGLRALTQDPETSTVLESIAIMNMEGEGLTDVREFYRAKLVKMGVVKPTDEEAEALANETANAKPDPQAQYLQSAANEAEANAAKKRADTTLSLAKAEESEARKHEILAGIGRDDSAHTLDLGRAMHEAGQPPKQPAGPPAA